MAASASEWRQRGIPENPRMYSGVANFDDLAARSLVFHHGAMNLHLVDVNPALVAAWRASFKPFPEVKLRCGDILQSARHCLVSPANSHGFMDGGIDDAYRAFFGRQIEQIVQEAILRRPEGMLPVGTSLVVRTGHVRIPFLIVAPTMEMPEPVPANHAGRAMRAVLRMVDQNPALADDVYSPGLGTWTGMIPLELAAAEMAAVYGEWRRKEI